MRKNIIKRIKTAKQWDLRVLEATQKGMKPLTKLDQKGKSPRMIKKSAVMHRLIEKAAQARMESEANMLSNRWNWIDVGTPRTTLSCFTCK